MSRHAIIEGGVVANVVVGAVPGAVPCGPDVGIGWACSGGTFSPPEEPEVEASPAEIIEQFRAAIQQHVDVTAVSRRYDNGVSLASYVASGNPEWADEAQAFVAWRDAVWTYAYAELDKVLAAEREQPSVEEFIGELPVIAWPDI